ncbi:uncharacterized protein PRCAT00004023001 [Priceomyces carsonii]|uniref:uncharacterized protein n=1 Tax=Priceomyces carsonii TaxID=28549 RepID=UPI002ED9AF58|nr:unnamed protein product [Priceomyces carsonii]
MIKDLILQRVDASSSIHDPFQCSENLQIAINNGSQLTILDPKLPLLHQSINSVNDIKVLDPKGIFTPNTILYPEALDSLPLRSFNRVVVETLDEGFNFSGINEPMITSQKWSPVDPYSRDCLLGVLFNTCELLIFERANNHPDQYTVKYNLFDQLILQLHLESSDSTEIFVTNDQLEYLRIKSFDFTLITSSMESILLLSVISNNGTLMIYKLGIDSSLQVLSSFQTNQNVVKHQWSEWRENDGKITSYLSLICSDNSVSFVTADFDIKTDHIAILIPQTIIKKSRFLISQVKWICTRFDVILIVTSTDSLKIIYINDIIDQKVLVQRLSNFNFISSIISCHTNEILTLIIGFENGEFESFILDLKKKILSSKQLNKLLSNFVSKSLYKFQLTNSSRDEQELMEVKMENEISSPSITPKPPSDLTRPYLSQIVEGDFTLCGMSLSSRGIISIVYKIVPKNVMNYTILSKSELHIGFLHAAELCNDSEPETKLTSIQFINQLWLTNYKNIAAFPKLLGDKQEEISKFVFNILAFKEENLIDIDKLSLIIDNNAINSNFTSYLLQNFNNNVGLKKLQILYNFNLVLLGSLKILKQYDNEDCNKLLTKLHNEQEQIDHLISKHLSKIILNYIHEKTHDEYDKFLAISHFLQLGAPDEDQYKKSLPESSEISVQTKFFQETFKATIDDINTEQVLIKSTSDHHWSRCKLTLLPLLEMTNNIDELNKFNYVPGLVCTNGNAFTNQLRRSINYCIITGNKTYSFS